MTEEEGQRATDTPRGPRWPGGSREATIAEQAAGWLVANRDEPDPGRQAAFVAWLRADPAHAQAYADALKLASTLQRALPRPAPSAEALITAARTAPPLVEPIRERPAPAPASLTRRRWLYAVAAALIPLVALTWLWPLKLGPPRGAQPGERFATGHGQQLEKVLADGSVLHLNTDTTVTVRLAAGSRRVALERGQVVFNVAHDAARPFEVTAGSARVTAVGTQFDVYLQSEATVVTVLEGRVEVAPTVHDARPAMLVSAGEQVRVVHGELPAAPSAVDPRRSTAWLHRQIAFRREPLAHVVEEFNRYTATPIQIDSPSLGELPVSGVFNVDDTESMVAFLRSLNGVRVEVTPSTIRVSGG